MSGGAWAARPGDGGKGMALPRGSGWSARALVLGSLVEDGGKEGGEPSSWEREGSGRWSRQRDRWGSAGLVCKQSHHTHLVATLVSAAHSSGGSDPHYAQEATVSKLNLLSLSGGYTVEQNAILFPEIEDRLPEPLWLPSSLGYTRLKAHSSQARRELINEGGEEKQD